MTAEGLVLIAHCIDTEGPLYESLEAKFERLGDLFGITGLPHSKETLARLQAKQIALGGKEERVAKTLNGHLLNYNDSWEKIDAMLERICSPEFRCRLEDSFGGGWVYNWHCMDHVGYEYNPRRRDIGYHNIFDHYREFMAVHPSRDELHWHFHPMSNYRDAHRCATSYTNSPELYQILCRKIIERNWWPVVYRAGFHVERPDSHHFLEQWIPFDISNISMDDNGPLEEMVDFRKGRTGDWRLAPADWSLYHPSHDYYQLPGDCRRWIARALSVMNRTASIDQAEMDKAFRAAGEGKRVIVGITGHDFRDLGAEVDFVRALIRESQQKYPGVRFKFCEAVEAFREAIWPEGVQEEPLDLELRFNPGGKDDVPSLDILTRRGKVFGPQPFLALRTKSRRFIHDNLDFSTSMRDWSYAFYGSTLPIEDVAEIGVAASDRFGNTCIKRLTIEDGGKSARTL